MAKKNRSNNKTNRENTKSVVPQPVSPPKGQFVTYFVIFVFGFLAGIAFTVYKSNLSDPIPGTTPTTQVKQSDSEQAIINLEAEVTANPENYQAWTRLGHLYFDMGQPTKAIKAYHKSLELHQGDANLFTDLGVMYRRNKQPKEAITYFDKAIAMDATHIPSRFNKGIVLLYDLNNHQEAIASWKSILTIDPAATTSNGELLKDFIARIQASHTTTRDLQ